MDNPIQQVMLQALEAHVKEREAEAFKSGYVRGYNKGRTFHSRQARKSERKSSPSGGMRS